MTKIIHEICRLRWWFAALIFCLGMMAGGARADVIPTGLQGEWCLSDINVDNGLMYYKRGPCKNKSTITLNIKPFGMVISGKMAKLCTGPQIEEGPKIGWFIKFACGPTNDKGPVVSREYFMYPTVNGLLAVMPLEG